MFKVHPIYGCIGAICYLLSVGSAAADVITPAGIAVSHDVKHDLSLPLRHLQPQGNLLHSSYVSSFKKFSSENPDLLSPTTTAPSFLIPLRGFQGIGVGLGDYIVKEAKPDPAASVGMTQYVEWVNTDMAVFDKATGQVLPGFPKPGNALWAGFGGPCETTNFGSAIVKYDQLAQRWIVGKFAYTSETGPFYQCLAVSTSEDATGSYHRYAFQVDSNSDNQRLGLWRDAYYMAINMSGPTVHGPKICALERSKMLVGLPTTMQCRQLNLLQSGRLLPADLDGDQLPPLGSPAYFMGLDEPNNLLITKFYVDFNNPNNTNTTIITTPVATYSEACRDVKGEKCAIQPNTTNRLNVYSDRLMSRMVYRQFRDYGSMVVSHTVTGPAPKLSPAVRWYELRVSASSSNFNPVLYQQSTLAPDSKARFLGSIAIDRFTNIALGYTVSSSLIYPSLELAAHNYNDQLNVMTIQPLVTGRGSQIGDNTEWGYRSNMSVDPIDECTFWYTSEYLKSSGTFNWSTYIIKFKLAACT